ncbi:MAG: RNAse [Chthonomonadales bacterium]|nr:RNAse [Chthonomonadales bacterium]
MSKEIIVNVGERETRIAVTEDGKLVEMHVERAERVVGSLYKCRVANVLPGMDASFVDVGLERNAFLYVGDVLPTGDDTSSTGDSDSSRKSAERRPRVGNDRRANGDASIIASLAPVASDDPYAEEGEVETAEEPLGDATDALQAAAEAELRLLDEDDEEPETSGESDAEGGRSTAPRRNTRRSALRQQRIKDVLKVGQELLVQVIKGPRSTKGARVSTRISMPGRYLVLMPEGDNLGVSRKIEDPKERDRLKKIGDRLREPGFGLIIRTEAEEKTEQELRADWDFLMSNWRQVVEKSKKMSAPALIQQDLTLLYKTIRDVFGSDVSKLVIDEPGEYEKANELLERISPNLRGRIHLYDGAVPIFDHYKVEQEMDRLLRRKVFLKTGGSLVIDETEALTVIDVNTSKFTGGGSLQETIVKTNLDAAGEIARQLRLRDIGGIIVIDFIDMNNARDKQAVLKTLEAVLKKDRSRTKISNISPLGLVEMTRKRTGETLTGFMTDECPYCKGRGHLPSAESVSLVIERDLRRQIGDPKNVRKEAFLITCHPEVAELVIGPEGTNITWLEQQVQRALYVRCDLNAHIEKYSIEGGEINDYDKTRLGFRRAQIVECRVVRSLLKEPNKCIGWAEGYLLDLDDGYKMVGQRAKVRITDVRRSYATASVIPGSNRPLE